MILDFGVVENHFHDMILAVCRKIFDSADVGKPLLTGSSTSCELLLEVGRVAEREFAVLIPVDANYRDHKTLNSVVLVNWMTT